MMKQVRLILILTTAIIFLGSTLSAQDLSEAIKQASISIDSIKNLSCNIHFLSYSKNGLLSQIDMKFEKVGGINYMRMDNVDSYQMDSTQIVIDHNEKYILLNTGIKIVSSNSGISKQLKLVSSLEAHADKVTVKTEKGNRIYTLIFQDEQFTRIDFKVDTLSGLFQSLRLIPAEPVHNAMETEELPVVAYEVLVSNYNSNLQKLSKPYSDFLELKDKRYILKPTYSTYHYENNYDWQ